MRWATAHRRSGGRGLAALTALALVPALMADTVTLHSGTVLTGEIVGENAHEVRILVSRTADGDIETVKVVRQSAVADLRRDRPAVAIEANPGAAASRETETPAEPDFGPRLGVWRETLKQADAQTAEGAYDAAIEHLRGVIDQTEHAQTQTAAPDVLLPVLEVREHAYRHLVITLRGKRQSQDEALRAEETAALRLERTLLDARREMETLQRPQSATDSSGIRRLGDGADRAPASARQRELEEQIATGQARLQAYRRWAAETRQAQVNLDAEIKLAEASARRAETERNNAVRQSTRRGR